jgi:4-amino-4-deoxy-L-arabinose transferase-like glycosyltransferase
VVLPTTWSLAPFPSAGSIEMLEGADEPRSRSASPRWFGLGLLLLVVLGIAMRLVFAIVWQDGKTLQGDPMVFQQTAAYIAHGKGYVTPFFGYGTAATALHPPVFPIVLAVLDVLGIQSADAHRIVLAFIASGGIAAMGFLGRRLMSPTAGLLAASIAALSPLWVQPSGKVLSESVYLVVIPLVLLAALRCIERPSPLRFALIGLTIGIAALTRSEAMSLILLLGIPLVLFATRPLKERAKLGLILLAGFALIVGPWLIRNDVELGGFTISTDSGTTLVGAYTPATFDPSSPLYGSFAGNYGFEATSLALKYVHPPGHAKRWTELTLSNEIGHFATTYARGHLSDLPGVVLAREGRLWGLYASGSQLQFDLASDADGVRGFQLAGQYLNWFLIPLTIGGGIVLYRRSRRDLVVVAAPIVAAALNAALTYGSTRYRAVAEPSDAVLAAIGALFVFERIRRASWRSPRLNSAKVGDAPEGQDPGSKGGRKKMKGAGTAGATDCTSKVLLPLMVSPVVF